jgi:disulfide oxidoreductase YuzD
MAEIKGNICVNSIENAKKFLDNQDKRKAPNNRVNGYHFLDIANKGAERLKEKMIKK